MATHKMERNCEELVSSKEVMKSLIKGLTRLVTEVNERVNESLAVFLSATSGRERFPDRGIQICIRYS